MQIKADGVGTLVHLDAEGRRHVVSVRAWFTREDGAYKWSRFPFGAEEAALRYGKRVAERYNRIFGKETVKDAKTS